MRENRLQKIAFELSNLWNYLTRQELCEYYDITDRTLYNYQKALNLPKKTKEVSKVKAENPIDIYIKDGTVYKRKSFAGWEFFTKWINAQSHYIQLGTMEQKGKKYNTCVFTQKKKEAQAYEDKICL